MHLVHTDIMKLVMETWRKGFGNVENNKKAICDRGYLPFTLAMLLNPALRVTMTEDMIQWERDTGLFLKWAIDKKKTVQYVEDSGSVLLNSVRASDNLSKRVNFERGAMAQHVADTILGEVDRQNHVREYKKGKEMEIQDVIE